MRLDVTLVLSILTQEYVLQASDRRLVTLPDRRFKDDDAIKAVLFGSNTCFAYTGLAELPRSLAMKRARGGELRRLPTNMWLAEALTLGDGLQGAIEAVEREATLAFRSLGRIPHAFIGVGFSNEQEGAPIQPALYVITNFDGSTVRPSFDFTLVRLGDQPYGSASSHPLPHAILETYDSKLEDYMRRGLGPAAIAGLMIETIRRVASGDQTVGRGIIQTCLPRAQVDAALVGRQWSMSAAEPALDRVTFRYIPDDKYAGEQASPTVVLEDKTIFGQLWIGDTPVNVDMTGTAHNDEAHPANQSDS